MQYTNITQVTDQLHAMALYASQAPDGIRLSDFHYIGPMPATVLDQFADLIGEKVTRGESDNFVFLNRADIAKIINLKFELPERFCVTVKSYGFRYVPTADGLYERKEITPEQHAESLKCPF